jgi:hypothetical protein
MDPLPGNDRETNNETKTVARQRSARQWTSWKVIYPAKSAPMAAYATVDTTMGSGVFFAVHAEGL